MDLDFSLRFNIRTFRTGHLSIYNHGCSTLKLSANLIPCFPQTDNATYLHSASPTPFSGIFSKMEVQKLYICAGHYPAWSLG